MGMLLGNWLGRLLMVASLCFGFVSFDAAAYAFLVIAYMAWIVVSFANLSTRPSSDTLFCTFFLDSPGEVVAYRKYHMHIRFPGAAQAYSALLNNFRLAAILWAVLLLWHGRYWMGGAAIVYSLLATLLVVILCPRLYMETAAHKGEGFAAGQLHLIEILEAKWAAYVQSGVR